MIQKKRLQNRKRINLEEVITQDQCKHFESPKIKISEWQKKMQGNLGETENFQISHPKSRRKANRFRNGRANDRSENLDAAANKRRAHCSGEKGKICTYNDRRKFIGGKEGSN